MELEEQRRDKGQLWQQTKESILEARGIISSTNSLSGEEGEATCPAFFNKSFCEGDLLRERLRQEDEKLNLTNGAYAKVPYNDSTWMS